MKFATFCFSNTVVVKVYIGRLGTFVWRLLTVFLCFRLVVSSSMFPSEASQPQPWQSAWHSLHLRGQGHWRLLRWCRGRLSALPRLCSGLRVWGEEREFHVICWISSFMFQKLFLHKNSPGLGLIVSQILQILQISCRKYSQWISSQRLLWWLDSAEINTASRSSIHWLAVSFSSDIHNAVNDKKPLCDPQAYEFDCSRSRYQCVGGYRIFSQLFSVYVSWWSSDQH